MPRRILGLAVIGLLALGASGAQARPFEAPEQAVYWDAVEWWGQEPHCQTVAREVVSPSDFRLPTGDTGVAYPAPSPHEGFCELLLNEGALGSGLDCELMTHEVGHLLGYGHSSDPTNIMFPQLSDRVSFTCPSPDPTLVALKEKLFERHYRCVMFVDTPTCWERARFAREVLRYYEAKPPTAAQPE